MRADLAKCTTERERYGAKGKCFKTKYRGKVRIHPDPDYDYPTEHGGFRSSSRRRHWESKEFSDVLNPLIGAIRKNLGRPWNKVFSEFCEVLDRRSVSGYHIWTHLMQEVTTKTYLENGKVYEITKYGAGPMEVDGFYVHPVTGLLCHRPRPTKAQVRARWSSIGPKKPPEFIVPGLESWRYKEFDGIWFRYNVVEKDTSYGTSFVDIVKRQCNKKEVAWIKLQLS
jgi:hypothetical protein